MLVYDVIVPVSIKSGLFVRSNYLDLGRHSEPGTVDQAIRMINNKYQTVTNQVVGSGMPGYISQMRGRILCVGMMLRSRRGMGARH